MIHFATILLLLIVALMLLFIAIGEKNKED
jgi:hypothetical protein